MAPAAEGNVRAVLLDVEGTTTPVEFVYGALFPYARARLGEFLRAHAREEGVESDLERLRAEHAAEAARGEVPPPWREGTPEERLDSAVAYLLWLMDHDRKSTALKSVQGKIWEEGYRTGEIRGDIYPDVPAAFERWRREGRLIGLFSSGSVLAQKLLFAHTPAGDLTPFLRAHFDTATGHKREAESYRRIAAALELPPPQVLFVSDVAEELDAAAAAGMRTALCARSGPPRLAVRAHPLVRSLEDVGPPVPEPFAAPASWLVENADLLPRGEAALDLACGGGRNALYLAARGCSVRAVDRDGERIAALRAAAEGLGLRLEAEVTDLEAGGVHLGREVYDLVVGVHYLHRPLFPALIAALRPGGLLVWETFTVEQASRGKPTNPDFLLKPGELHRLVAPLEILRAREGEFEGRMVAGIVARKPA